MIRFPCPVCDQMLKVPDKKATTSVICPRCNEQCMVPSVSVDTELPGRPSAGSSDRREGLLAGMSGRMRLALALVACVGLVSLLMVVAVPRLNMDPDDAIAARRNALILFFGILAAFLVLIQAHLTSCPACRKWWARRQGETSSLERHVSDEGGVRHVRAMRQTTYVCTYCGHSWAATFTDEYREGRGPVRQRGKSNSR